MNQKCLAVTDLCLIISMLLCGCQETKMQENLDRHDAPVQNTSVSLQYRETPGSLGPCAVLEIDSSVIISLNSPLNIAPYDEFTLEGFDAHNGDSLFLLSEMDYQEYGSLYRVEKTDVLPDCNYRLVFEKGVVYKNAADPQMEKAYILSDDISARLLSNDNDNIRGSYDVHQRQLVLTDAQGVWLSDGNGENMRCILENSAISERLPDGFNKSVFYGDPRFLCEASMLAVGIFDSAENMYCGVVCYDLDTDTIVQTLTTMLPIKPEYPIQDRYLIVNESTSINVFDAQTASVEKHPTGIALPFYRTVDYKTFLVAKYESMDFENADIFVCDIGHLQNEANVIFSERNGEHVFIVAATENYAVLWNQDREELLLISYQSAKEG